MPSLFTSLSFRKQFCSCVKCTHQASVFHSQDEAAGSAPWSWIQTARNKNRRRSSDISLPGRFILEVTPAERQRVWQTGLPLVHLVTTSAYFLPLCCPREERECVCVCACVLTRERVCMHVCVFLVTAHHSHCGQVSSRPGSWFRGRVDSCRISHKCHAMTHTFEYTNSSHYLSISNFFSFSFVRRVVWVEAPNLSDLHVTGALEIKNG